MTTTPCHGHISPRDYQLVTQNVLFHGMNFHSVEYMLEYCSVLELTENNILLRPDKNNQQLFLILEGTLDVYLAKDVLNKGDKPHTELHAGDCVGEVSIIDGKNPTALVVASKVCRLLVVPAFTMWSLITQSHTIARNLLNVMAGRIRFDKVTLIESEHRKSLFEHQASVDALTGIYNRHWMKTGFSRALSRCKYEKKPFAIMMVDIDHFKHINDAYGHLLGDVALQFVTKCIAENLRPYDLLVRYGGEEFVVFLQETQLEHALIVASRLRNAIANTEIVYQDIRLTATVSIGIQPSDYKIELEQLIDQADKALYQAKQNGRNRVEVYT